MSSYSNSVACGSTRASLGPPVDGRSQIERRLDEQACVIDELENAILGFIEKVQVVSSPCVIDGEGQEANKTAQPVSVLQYRIESSTRRLRAAYERIRDASSALEI